MMLRRLWRLWVAAITFPGLFLHEWTHAAVGRALGAQSAVVQVRPTAQALIKFDSDTNPLRIRLACLAPTIVGGCVGVIVAVVGIPELPPVALVYLGATWAFYTAPSQSDLAPFSVGTVE